MPIFPYWVICFLLVEVLEFLIYSRSKSFATYVIWKCFLCGVFYHSLTNFFPRVKVFNFAVQFINFSLVGYAFQVLCKKCLCNPRLQRFSSMLCSRSVIGLCLSFLYWYSLIATYFLYTNHCVNILHSDVKRIKNNNIFKDTLKLCHH